MYLMSNLPSSRIYVNVHPGASPGGAFYRIRGVLRKPDAAARHVYEPFSWYCR